MKKVITEDNSITFFNEEFQDHYHSKSGAKEEAFEKHTKALKITPNSIIFDMFFGLGYNSAAALDIAKNLTIYCFENDKEILKQILKINADFKSWPIIQEFIKQFLEKNILVYEKDNVKLIMIFGDARKTIKGIKTKADFVFFDPFSPAKVPELWTFEFFQDIKAKMKKSAKLSTYSYARFVRDNLKSAGFKVIDGPTIGRRSPSTIAINVKEN